MLFGAQKPTATSGRAIAWPSMSACMQRRNNDFTGVPWHRLPELRRRASEFYADQPVVSSYLALCWRFVTDPTLSIGSRMVRPSRGGWR